MHDSACSRNRLAGTAVAGMVRGRGLLPALAPALAGGVAAAALAAAPGLREGVTPWLPATVLAALGGAVLLALALRRSRGLWAVLALALAFDTTRRWGGPPGDDGPASFAWAATALLLPLLLASIALASDRPLGSAGGLGCGVVVAAAPLGAAFLWLSFQDRAIAAILYTPAGSPVPLPLAGLAAALLASLVVILRTVQRRTALEGSLLGSLWLAVGGLAAGPGSAWLPLLLALGAVVVLVGMSRSAFELAFLDPLTGLPGRRALEEDLRGLDGPLVAAMVDIDHFKSVNDTHGHEVGDQVLRMVASRLALVGGGGKAYRWGGEEFALLFPGRTLAQVRPHVEAVREAIAASPFVLRAEDRPKRTPRRRGSGSGRPTLAVTVSGGLAEGQGSEAAALLKAADAALYRAKNAGRNRICEAVTASRGAAG
ncbi:MAG TPA: GGDEF domain-containing protein [Thermoanaerobaculaceae bacterium]|nr:GGDEF domain-containing protein [Thermoanaerobaculaceae bacterium]HRS16975.1 GGDEF domain-containing protein [Thermoanaerobaculaceae bacterium]